MFHVEHSERVAQWLRSGAAELGLPLQDPAIESFLKYLIEIKKWNRKVNLTALRTDEEVVIKHFLDSLVCCKALKVPGQARLLDIGAGAGFPGLPIKIVLTSIRLTLLERSQKKTAFLRHIVGMLGLQGVTVVPARLEGAAGVPQVEPPFSHAVSRAVNLRELARFIGPLLGEQGVLVLWQGPRKRTRVDDLEGFRQEAVYPYTLPFGYGERYLIVFVKK